VSLQSDGRIITGSIEEDGYKNIFMVSGFSCFCWVFGSALNPHWSMQIRIQLFFLNILNADPDPQSQYGSGSKTAKSVLFRIHDTGFLIGWIGRHGAGWLSRSAELKDAADFHYSS
jgi:hypothetical protein